MIPKQIVDLVDAQRATLDTVQKELAVTVKDGGVIVLKPAAPAKTAPSDSEDQNRADQ